MALRADDVDLGRDHDLVVRSQSGDDGAFEDLYRRYFDRLYRFCLRRVGDPHEAEELAQETFARAYGALPRLAGERRFYPWLSVIASRLCVDEYRRRSRSEPAAVIDLGVGDGGQERVLQAFDADLLARAIERLTPRHQDVLRLREHEGWSYQHIADHMGVNLGTVEALLHRARRALKREFDVLAGPETVPVAVGGGLLAAFARRLQALRAKVAGWDEAWLPLLGNAVAAVVLMVGTSVVGSSGAVATTAMAVSSGMPVASVVGMAADGTFTGGGAATASSPPGRQNHGGGGGSFQPGKDVIVDVVGQDVGNGVILVGDDDERPRDQTTVIDAYGVTVGADPETTMAEATATAERYGDDLRDGDL